MSMFITNNVDRETILQTTYYWRGLFSDEELDKIIQISKEDPLIKSSLADKDFKEDTKKKMLENMNASEYEKFLVNSRKSKSNFHGITEKNKWIFDKINWVINSVNSECFNFDLTGYDYYQYTEYHGNEKGTYDWHMDMPIGSLGAFRKLSLTLLLNDPEKDFDGGKFMVNVSSERVAYSLPLKKGDIVFFPSFVLHKVSPVTRGIRKSLVVWVLGPKFK